MKMFASCLEMLILRGFFGDVDYKFENIMGALISSIGLSISIDTVLTTPSSI